MQKFTLRTAWCLLFLTIFFLSFTPKIFAHSAPADITCNVSATTANGAIIITGMTGNENTKVFTTDFSIVWECNIWQSPCTGEEIITGLDEGVTYFVSVESDECEEFITLVVEGTPEPVGCNVSVSTADGAITIRGMTADANTKLFTTDFSIVWECNIWDSPCTDEETITGLDAGVTYLVSVESDECEELIPIVVEGEGETEACPNGDCIELDCVGDIEANTNPGDSNVVLFRASYYEASTACPTGDVTITTSHNLNPGSDLFPVGETEVTVTATDECGSTATCSFTVTVNAIGPCHFAQIVPAGTTCNDGDDNTENDVILADGCTCAGTPVSTSTCPATNGDCLSINCVNDIVTIANPGDNSRTLFIFSYFNVDSACPTGDVTINTSRNLDPGSDVFPVGTTEVTVTAMDNCGNTASCSFTVTVIRFGACHFGQPVPPGTSCDDGDASTENDVILADGCLCEGTSVSVDCNNVTDELAGATFMGTFGASNYFLSDDRDTWEGGQQFAADNGGHLASIGDAFENEFIRAFINETREIAFIGYQDLEEDGTYEWDSGETVDYTNVPTGANARAVTNINFWNGEWSFDGTFTQRRFVIEIPCDGSAGVARDTDLLEAESSEQKTGKTIRLENLFPNPTSDDIFVKLESTTEQNVELTVFDPFGKALQQQTHRLEEGVKVLSVLTNDLPGGMYLLMIQSDTGTRPVTKRFFKVAM